MMHSLERMLAEYKKLESMLEEDVLVSLGELKQRCNEAYDMDDSLLSML